MGVGVSMNCLYLTYGDKNCSKLNEIIRLITGLTQMIQCNFSDSIEKNIEPNCGIFRKALE